MTKDQIERYGGICDKIVALRSLKVRDTVQGSSSEIPYQKHTIVLEGRMEDGKNSKLQALKRQKAAIEAAVEAIEDETDQAVISMRVLGRLTWNEIAGKPVSYTHLMRNRGTLARLTEPQNSAKYQDGEPRALVE